MKRSSTLHPNVDSPLLPSMEILAGHPFAAVIEIFLRKMGMPPSVVVVSHNTMHGFTYYCPIDGFGYFLNVNRDYRGCIYVGLSIAFGLIPGQNAEEIAMKLLHENSCHLGPYRIGIYPRGIVAIQFSLHEEWLTMEHLEHRLPQLYGLAVYSRDKFIHDLTPFPPDWFKEESAC